MNQCLYSQGTSFFMTVVDAVDSLSLDRRSDLSGCTLTMYTNGEVSGSITIQSWRMAEGLRFMLKQMMDELDG